MSDDDDDDDRHCNGNGSCIFEEVSDRRDILQTLLSSGIASVTASTIATVTAATASGTFSLVNPVFALEGVSENTISNGSSNKTPKKSLGEEYLQGTAALANMDSKAPAPESAYIKLPSGVIYADLRPGTGEEVLEGSRVNLQWVLRKSNGYFVDSSEVQNGVPFIFTVGDKTAAIEGLDEGIRGMRQGGTRRILIPPSLAYVQGLEDGLPGPLPAGYGPRQQMRRVQTLRKDVPGEYIFLEILVTRVR
jgi:FKBP-type peptidyl-prolyl cis-trans isomerase